MPPLSEPYGLQQAIVRERRASRGRRSTPGNRLDDSTLVTSVLERSILERCEDRDGRNEVWLQAWEDRLRCREREVLDCESQLSAMGLRLKQPATVVLRLRCAGCECLLSTRGMLVRLVNDTAVELYSTDHLPFGALEAADDIPHGICGCQGREFACQCGRAIGYHVCMWCDGCSKEAGQRKPGHDWYVYSDCSLAEPAREGGETLMWPGTAPENVLGNLSVVGSLGCPRDRTKSEEREFSDENKLGRAGKMYCGDAQGGADTDCWHCSPLAERNGRSRVEAGNYATREAEVAEREAATLAREDAATTREAEIFAQELRLGAREKYINDVAIAQEEAEREMEARETALQQRIDDAETRARNAISLRDQAQERSEDAILARRALSIELDEARQKADEMVRQAERDTASMTVELDGVRAQLAAAQSELIRERELLVQTNKAAEDRIDRLRSEAREQVRSAVAEEAMRAVQQRADLERHHQEQLQRSVVEEAQKAEAQRADLELRHHNLVRAMLHESASRPTVEEATGARFGTARPLQSAPQPVGDQRVFEFEREIVSLRAELAHVSQQLQASEAEAAALRSEGQTCNGFVEARLAVAQKLASKRAELSSWQDSLAAREAALARVDGGCWSMPAVSPPIGPTRSALAAPASWAYAPSTWSQLGTPSVGTLTPDGSGVPPPTAWDSTGSGSSLVSLFSSLGCMRRRRSMARDPRPPWVRDTTM